MGAGYTHMRTGKQANRQTQKYPHLCRTQVTFANWQKLQQMLSSRFIELLKLLLMMFPSIPGYSVTPTQCGEKVNSRHPSKNIYIYLYIPPGVELPTLAGS